MSKRPFFRRWRSRSAARPATSTAVDVQRPPPAWETLARRSVAEQAGFERGDGLWGLLGMVSARRASRAAVRDLAPFLAFTERRRGPIDGWFWRTPYAIGFFSTLISLSALTASRGRLSGEALGSAQITAWARLTGMPDDVIGEEILLLSAENDPLFVDGCLEARRFFDARRGPPPQAFGVDVEMLWAAATPAERRAFRPGGPTAAAMWARVFEARLP